MAGAARGDSVLGSSVVTLPTQPPPALQPAERLVRRNLLHLQPCNSTPARQHFINKYIFLFNKEPNVMLLSTLNVLEIPQKQVPVLTYIMEL